MMSEFFDLSSEMQLDSRRIDATAVAISALLLDAACTKTVTTEQIAAELADDTGIAAYDENGEPAGYIAARPYGLLDEAVLALGDEQITAKRVPHVGIGSLVVHPGQRGKELWVPHS